MERQAGAQAMRPILADRTSQLGQTEAAIIGGRRRGGRPVELAEDEMIGLDALPVGLAGAQLQRAMHEVGIGHAQAARRAVELERAMAVARDVPAGAEHDLRAGRELEQGERRGRRGDRNGLALEGSGRAHQPRRRGGAGQGADPGDGAQELDQLGQVVGANVEHRPAARLEEEAGIGMPVLHAARQEEGGAGDDLADRALIDQAARLARRRPQDRVRRGRDAQAQPLGQLDQRLGVGEVRGERLFGVDVLAGLERRPADLGMDRRHGEIEDDVDPVVRQQLGRAQRPEAVALGHHRRRLGPEIGAGLQLDVAKARRVLAIDVGDHAAADDADALAPHRPASQPCIVAIERRAKRAASLGRSCSATQ